MPQITSAVAEIVEATTEQITVAFPTYDSEAERHDLYRHTESMQGAPIRNGTKIAEDIDPSQDYVDGTVDPYEDYNYQLVSITVTPVEVPEFIFTVDTLNHHVAVSNASNSDGNGEYFTNEGEELTNSNGWYFEFDDGTWRLFDNSDTEQAVGSGDIGSPGNVVSWSGNESGISIDKQNSDRNQFEFTGGLGEFDLEVEQIGGSELSQSFQSLSDDEVITVSEPGIWRLSVMPTGEANRFRRLLFDNGGDCRKLFDILNWGTEVIWSTFSDIFYGCINMRIMDPNSPIISASNLVSENAFRDCVNLGNNDEADASIRGLPWHKFANTAREMFRGTSEFINNIDFNEIDVSEMNSLFAFLRSSGFNQSVDKWQLRPGGVDVSLVFRSCDNLTNQNLTTTLVGWVNNAVDNGNLPSGETHNATATNHVLNHDGSNAALLAEEDGGEHFATALDAWQFARAPYPDTETGALTSSRRSYYSRYRDGGAGVLITNFGTGYEIDDIITVNQNGNSSGSIIITNVDGSGAILDYAIEEAGTEYIPYDSVTLSGGSGSGAEGMFGMGWQVQPANIRDGNGTAMFTNW